MIDLMYKDCFITKGQDKTRSYMIDLMYKDCFITKGQNQIIYD